MSRVMLIVFVASALATTTANSGTLATPLVFSNGTTPAAVQCAVANVGSGPISVSSVQLFDIIGNPLALASTCPVPPATLPAHASCLAVGPFPFTPGGHCTATATGKFRLSLNLLNGVTYDPLVTMPGTK